MSPKELEKTIQNLLAREIAVTNEGDHFRHLHLSLLPGQPHDQRTCEDMIALFPASADQRQDLTTSTPAALETAGPRPGRETDDDNEEEDEDEKEAPEVTKKEREEETDDDHEEEKDERYARESESQRTALGFFTGSPSGKSIGRQQES